MEIIKKQNLGSTILFAFQKKILHLSNVVNKTPNACLAVEGTLPEL